MKMSQRSILKNANNRINSMSTKGQIIKDEGLSFDLQLNNTGALNNDDIYFSQNLINKGKTTCQIKSQKFLQTNDLNGKLVMLRLLQFRDDFNQLNEKKKIKSRKIAKSNLKQHIKLSKNGQKQVGQIFTLKKETKNKYRKCYKCEQSMNDKSIDMVHSCRAVSNKNKNDGKIYKSHKNMRNMGKNKKNAYNIDYLVDSHGNQEYSRYLQMRKYDNDLRQQQLLKNKQQQLIRDIKNDIQEVMERIQIIQNSQQQYITK